MKKQKVKLGLYGCGSRTRALLDSVFFDEEYEVAAAYDLRKEAAESACGKYGGEVCGTAERLVGHPGVEAFIISLDPFAHPAAFYQAIEAGKPIFIEKPIAMTAGEAWEMAKLAEARKVPVNVGLMRRHEKAHVAARRFLAENDPGALLSVNCRWFHAGETEMINCLNHDPGNFRMKVSQIPFHCCHALDAMLLYGGELKAVSAQGLKVIDRPYPSPDEVIATLEFANGAVGSFHYSSVCYRGDLSYIIHSENYTLSLVTGAETLEISHRPMLKSLREDGSKDCRNTFHANVGPETHKFFGGLPNHAVMLDFLDCVRTGAPMKVPILDAYKVAEMAEAIERSWKEKRPIPLPLRFDSPQ